MNNEMSKTFNLAQRIRALKPGMGFTVAGEKERQAACRAAKTLRDAGVIQWSLSTRKVGETKSFLVEIAP